MPFEFKEVERISEISAKDFQIHYVKPQKPVVVERITRYWPAFDKWNFDYIKQVAGDKIVPLYNNDPVDYSKKVNEPVAKMKMAEYVDLLQSQPTELRIFLYNLMKEVPDLQNDYKMPDLGLNLFKSLPMLFFGGEGSNVFMHYDIDLANILHFHFAGKKRCVIVSPEQSKFMYKIPYSVICREDINFDEPDFEKWPALKNLKPMFADLNHGDMLYMPEGYWHYMKYLTPGFSMSLRSLAKKPKNFSQAAYNIFIMRNLDNLMRKWKGQNWIDWKNDQAIAKTNVVL
ncbi:cupin-like domain-containing protein [Moheibacter lacus]|uniref:Cupin-like domain-containing protein n=1 Tax=Moheibacter lacus TaxID=2745851 RepID=A0A838ZT92_9FLAO|nr:cupin-like domain-containing protein [Moheibacter lacus]MBA5630205.1 cupin-like domain-containing protein [Moheibacter lacus]